MEQSPVPDPDFLLAAALAGLAPLTPQMMLAAGVGNLTHPAATERLREYWTSGEGAAKIRWGVPGDFGRCVKELRQYMPKPDQAEGYCSNLHLRATGARPGHAATEQRPG
jgi:hypothetical protein